MGERHPKRRKDKYNPYILSVEDGKNYISFEDGRGMSYYMEIAEELYVLMESFEKEDRHYLNERNRHIEHLQLTDEEIERRMIEPSKTLDEEIFRKMEKEQLYRALDLLPKIQRRRMMLYYFYDLTYEKIAEIEGCTVMPIKRSIDRGLKKIKKFFKNRG